MAEQTEIMKSIKLVHESLTNLINTKFDDISSKLENVTSELKNLKTKVQDIQLENNELKEKVEYLEKKTKRNNIIIFGLNIESTDKLQFIVDTINSNLDLQIKPSDINYFYQLKSTGVSPIIVEFMSFFTKLVVLKSLHKLKGKNFSIANDKTKQEQEINQVLRKNLKEAKNLKLDAKIKDNKLCIGDQTFTYSELKGCDKLSTLLNKAESIVDPEAQSKNQKTIANCENKETTEKLQDKFSNNLQLFKEISDSNSTSNKRKPESGDIASSTRAKSKRQF